MGNGQYIAGKHVASQGPAPGNTSKARHGRGRWESDAVVRAHMASLLKGNRPGCLLFEASKGIPAHVVRDAVDTVRESRP